MTATTRTLCFTLLVAASACQGRRDKEKSDPASVTDSEERTLHQLYPNATYARMCGTRIRDGSVITFRITVPSGAPEPNDIPAFPIVIVPDSGLPRELSRTPTNASGVRDTAVRSREPLDSGQAVSASRRLASEATVLHRYSRLSGGAWVEWLRPDASVKDRSLGGVVVAVNARGFAEPTMRF